MLETIRAYALVRLAESGEIGTIRRDHAQFFLGLVEQAEPQLRGNKQSVWLKRLETEHANLRADLQWALDEEAADIGLRLVGSLRWFWTFRSHVNEGYQWAKAMLDRTEARQPTAAGAKALWPAGVMAWLRHPAAASCRSQLEQSEALWRVIGDKAGRGYALQHLGIVVAEQGDHRSARLLEEESVSLFRAEGDKPGMALATLSLGFVMTGLHQHEAAQALFEESAQLAREIDDTWSLALALSNLGRLVKVRGTMPWDLPCSHSA